VFRQAILTDVIESILPGDVLAFHGYGLISDIVCDATNSVVSHVGIVLSGGPTPRIVESTSLSGFTGVTDSDLVKRISEYNGCVWWLPLSLENHQKLNVNVFDDWLKEQEGNKYDTWGAIEVALRIHHEHHSGEWFCSAIDWAALQRAGVAPITPTADMMRPTDLVASSIFSGDYWQILGPKLEIPEFRNKVEQ